MKLFKNHIDMDKEYKNALLVILTCLISIYCRADIVVKNENTVLVEQAFAFMNEDNVEGLLSIINDTKHENRTNIKILMGIKATNISVVLNAQSKDVISYYCVLPGAASYVSCYSLNQQLDNELSTILSKNVVMNGNLNIRTISTTGKRMIDISDGRNPFSLYLDIVLNKYIADSKSDEDLKLTVPLVVADAYSRALDRKEYFTQTFVDELGLIMKENRVTKYSKAVADKIVNANINKSEWDNVVAELRQETEGKAVVQKESEKTSSKSEWDNVVAELRQETEEKVVVQKESEKSGNLIDYLDNLVTNIWIIITCITGVIIIFVVLLLWRKRIKNSKMQEIRENMPASKQIGMFLSPQFTKWRIKSLSLDFNKSKEQQIMLGENMYDQVHRSEATTSGWALAALGKEITQNCSPEKFIESIESFEKIVIPKYNNDLEEHERTRKRLISIQPILQGEQSQIKMLLENEFITLMRRFKELNSDLEQGILAYAEKANVFPFAFFMQVITDSQNRFDRFVRQGAIMGMIDFLMKYKDDNIIKPYFENMIAARHDMISSDHQMSFFEVRAPMECTTKQYALILKEVLHCANPIINYCDTEQLMKIAEKEIPGIMDLLVHYPLRLIDHGHKSVKGVYNFEPYRHAMWVRYTPPLNEGQVQNRYHEVLDLTLPNSSGLNIWLFTDSYAAIPTMFHEYCHYMEDPNEASVALKTYAFSLKFYRKYKKASPENNADFITLNRLLGKSINPQQFNDLNKFIIERYGEKKSEKMAVEAAKSELANKNFFINLSNDTETWCPEVKMPLLDKNGDMANALLIAKICIRYAQVPRTITKEEFIRKMTAYMPMNRVRYKNYLDSLLQMFAISETKAISENKIKCYPKWKSFKDWCLSNLYIQQYMDINETSKIETLADIIISQNDLDKA